MFDYQRVGCVLRFASHVSTCLSVLELSNFQPPQRNIYLLPLTKAEFNAEKNAKNTFFTAKAL